jgi:ligand-binding sensor domain-containing protein/serine phosphatase RsbU (regulator of sigma subunit)
MKETVNTFSFTFFISFLICFLNTANEEMLAQQMLKPPPVVTAGKPRVIKVPASFESYIAKAGDHSINITPPKSFTLSGITSVPNKKNGASKSETGMGLFTTYTSDDGLALDAVYCSYMDHFGNLWFGTQGGGASKYDGKSFVTYTTSQGLASNNVWNILEDKSGNMWFCTNAGVSRYDGKSFVTYTLTQQHLNNNIWSIAEDNAGNIWIGTSGSGVSKFNGKSFVNYTTADGLVNNTIRSIFKDKAGTLWFGTNGGVSKYDGKSFVNYANIEGFGNNIIYCIMEDRLGNLWFGSNGGGACKYNGKSFVNYTTAQGLAGNSVRSIIEDKAGNLWFGTDGGGTSKFNGSYFIEYSSAQGLANNYIYSIIKDKIGNLWFSTGGGGISKYEGNAFVNYTTTQGLVQNVVWAITEDKKGNLWLGTNEGVSCFDGNTFTNYLSDQMDPVILSITTDKNGNIWFGSYHNGVYKFDGKKMVNYTMAQGLADNTVRCIVEDKAGNIWFATDNGVSFYDGKSFTTYTEAQGLVNSEAFCILQDKAGDMWFGTRGGVSFFDGHSFTNFTAAQGLANNILHCILEDKAGNMWFGTERGLSYYKRNRFHVLQSNDSKKNAAAQPTFNKQDLVEPLFKNITVTSGLPDDYITQVLELPNGKIAIGTNLGIAIFNGFDANDKLKDLEIFNSSKGYPLKDVNTGENTMYQDSKGSIWIATGSDMTGLARFDYTAVHHNQDPPSVVIENIKIDQENISWEHILKKNNAEKPRPSSPADTSAQNDSLSLLMSEFYAFGKSVPKSLLDNQFVRFGDVRFDSVGKFYPLPKNLVLPYGHNQISFEYAAIEPARPFLVRYQCMLEGYDTEWNPVTTQTSVNFGNMYEGSYTFKLKAQSPFGVWSEPVTYTFTVLPPWWRTWWVHASYAIFGICTVILITWWNGKRLRLKAKELAMEVHKATLTILEQKKIVEEQKHVVEEKNKHITESINYAQRIQNAILPENEYIKSLFSDYFIYYQPKEIVSGDFYWFGQKDDKIIFAAVDCTGHGVPGALMSMIGNTLLNEIINGKGIIEADEILNQLRSDIIYALKQKDALESQKDGMDIALCVLDKKENTLEFSGAHNSLYHFRNDVFSELKGDTQAIGYEKKEKQPFVKNKLTVQPGDMLYLFTDGFADQKGGNEKKKFYYKPFRELFAAIKNEPMMKQEEILRKTFNNWKGDIEQIDDVLVIGIRL